MRTSSTMHERRTKLAAIFEDLGTAFSTLDEAAKKSSQNYHKGSGGEAVHSSGKKENKKFANNTTFAPSPSDALLHTDGNKEGIRAKLPKDAFTRAATKEELKKDPRKKWYPVSYQRGWASAAGSLRQAYARGKDLKKEVMSKVKSTRFIGAEGGSIQPGTIEPTGALKGARGECKIKRVQHGDGTRRKVELRPSHPMHDHIKRLQAAGKHVEAGAHLSRIYRMCKDHGAGGPPEQGTSFAPKNTKHKGLHSPGQAPSHEKGVSHAELTSRAAAIKGGVRHMMRQSQASGERLSR